MKVKKELIEASYADEPVPQEILDHLEQDLNKGGPGSGNFGHLGYPRGAHHEALAELGFKHVRSEGELHHYSNPTGATATFHSGKGTTLIHHEGSKIGPHKNPKAFKEEYLARLGSMISFRDTTKGGQGSGNFGHEGRPGQIGGSGPGGSTSQEAIGRAWIDHAEGLPKDTLAHYTKPDGSLDPQRKILHDQIVKESLVGSTRIPDNQKPVAILMMGGTASGKSGIVDGLSKENLVVVDPDAVKQKLPEFEKAISKNARDAAFMVHEESSSIGKQIRDAAIADRRNLIVDGTGGSPSSPDKFGKMIDTLKKNGYEVRVMMSDLDYDKALGRMQERAEKTGRWVPPEEMKKIYDHAPKNFLPIARKADGWALFDNRVPKGQPPRLVWSRDRDKETLHDPKFVAAWKQKYGG